MGKGDNADMMARLEDLIHSPTIGSLIVTLNDEPATNHMTVAEWLESHADEYDWPSDEERKQAAATNKLWVIQWYPDTQVGFYLVAASTFEAAARFALERDNGQG